MMQYAKEIAKNTREDWAGIDLIVSSMSMTP